MEHDEPSPHVAAEFKTLAQRVMGGDWIQRLAHALDVNLRTAQRWAGAGRVISPRAWAFLREQDEVLKASDFDRRLGDLVSEAEEAGASPHVLTGRLREHADRLQARASA